MWGKKHTLYRVTMFGHIFTVSYRFPASQTCPCLNCKQVGLCCVCLCARGLLCEQYVSMCIALGGFFFPTIAVLLLSSSFPANHSSKRLQHGICFSVAGVIAGALTTSTPHALVMQGRRHNVHLYSELDSSLVFFSNSHAHQPALPDFTLPTFSDWVLACS